MSYANATQVSVERSKLELERLLVKHGAKQYGSAVDEESATALVYFKMAERHIRLTIPMPPASEWPDPNRPSWEQKAKHKPPRTWDRMTVENRKAWIRADIEQASRTRWRQMLLIVKAKLEIVAMHASTMEREFLPDVVLPDGRSVGELLQPAIAQAYLDGKMPPLLGSGAVEAEVE